MADSDVTNAKAAQREMTGAELLSIGLLGIAAVVWMTVARLLLPLIQARFSAQGKVLPDLLQTWIEVDHTLGMVLWAAPVLPVGIYVIAWSKAWRERAVIGTSLALMLAFTLALVATMLVLAADLMLATG